MSASASAHTARPAGPAEVGAAPDIARARSIVGSANHTTVFSSAGAEEATRLYGL